MLAVGNAPWRSQKQTLSLPHCTILHVQPSHHVQKAPLSKPSMYKDRSGPVEKWEDLCCVSCTSRNSPSALPSSNWAALESHALQPPFLPGKCTVCFVLLNVRMFPDIPNITRNVQQQSSAFLQSDLDWNIWRTRGEQLASGEISHLRIFLCSLLCLRDFPVAIDHFYQQPQGEEDQQNIHHNFRDDWGEVFSSC